MEEVKCIRAYSFRVDIHVIQMLVNLFIYLFILFLQIMCLAMRMLVKNTFKVHIYNNTLV